MKVSALTDRAELVNSAQEAVFAEAPAPVHRPHASAGSGFRPVILLVTRRPPLAPYFFFPPHKK